jgi:anti-sigma-K factor RskA
VTAERPDITCDAARDLAAGYVLGALDASEDAAVRRHLATCDQKHPEFETFGSVVPALLELDPSELVEPPAGLRDRILVAAAADLAQPTDAAGGRTVGERTVAEQTLVDAAKRSPTPFPSAAERAERPERADLAGRRPRLAASRFDWALRIAAVVAILAIGAWGLYLQGQLDRARAFDRAVAAVVHAAGQPGSKTVVLTAQGGYTSDGIAAVQPDGSVVIAMRDLPATAGGQVYAAWVIVGSSAPVPVGEFPVGSPGSAAFTTRPSTTPAGATIALTLEPNAGNPAPKGPIVSAGVAAAPPGANS